MLTKLFSYVATAIALSLFASHVTAQSQSIPLRYSATIVQQVQLPYSVTTVESAGDLGSDLHRIEIPGYLCVTTAPNAAFTNWGGNANHPQQLQMWGEIEVQGLVTPMVQLMPGHMAGIAPLPGNVPVGSTFRYRVETRHAANKPNSGHYIESTFLRMT